MKLYRIKDWSKHFEVRDSKRVSGPLSWVAVPTKTDGFGFSRISMEKDACDLLAAWYLMLGIAAKQDAPHRGELQRDGIPLTAEDMALITRFPVRAFVRALDFFSNPKQAWLEVDTKARTDGPLMDHAWTTDGPCVDQQCGCGVPTGQDTTRQDTTQQPSAADAAFELFWESYPKKTQKQDARKAFDKLLKRNPDSFAQELVEKTAAYAAAVALWSEDEQKYVPYPASWLNKGGYDDDPSTWVRNRQQFSEPTVRKVSAA